MKCLKDNREVKAIDCLSCIQYGQPIAYCFLHFDWNSKGEPKFTQNITPDENEEVITQEDILHIQQMWLYMEIKKKAEEQNAEKDKKIKEFQSKWLRAAALKIDSENTRLSMEAKD